MAHMDVYTACVRWQIFVYYGMLVRLGSVGVVLRNANEKYS